MNTSTPTTAPAGPTPGPWEYIPSTKDHGPYVVGPYGGDICDCYVMSNPLSLSARNGGESWPIHFQHEAADSNARLIAAAPTMLAVLEELVRAASEHANEHGCSGDLGARLYDARSIILKARGETP